MNKNMLKSLYISIIYPIVSLFILPLCFLNIMEDLNIDVQKFIIRPIYIIAIKFFMLFLLTFFLYLLIKISAINSFKNNILNLFIGLTLSATYVFISLKMYIRTLFDILIINIDFSFISIIIYAMLIIEYSYKLYKNKKHI